MSAARTASLDSSLLARKGAAAPAIADDSPLVQQLDDRRPKAVVEAEKPTPVPVPVSVVPDSAPPHDSLPAWRRLLAIRLAWRPVLIGAGVLAVVGVAGVLLVNGRTAPETKRSEVLPPAPPVAGPVAVPAAADAAVMAPADDIAVIKGPTVPQASDTEIAARAANLVAPTDAPALPAKPVPDQATAPVPAAPPAPSPVGTQIETKGAAETATLVAAVPRDKPAAPALPGARYVVQFASVPVAERAAAEAERLHGRIGHLLDGREIVVVEAALKGSRTTYRLRAGSYASLGEARQACNQVARLKVDCLAVRR